VLGYEKRILRRHHACCRGENGDDGGETIERHRRGRNNRTRPPLPRQLLARRLPHRQSCHSHYYYCCCYVCDLWNEDNDDVDDLMMTWTVRPRLPRPGPRLLQSLPDHWVDSDSFSSLSFHPTIPSDFHHHHHDNSDRQYRHRPHDCDSMFETDDGDDDVGDCDWMFLQNHLLSLL
jgi:hypothetical protein